MTLEQENKIKELAENLFKLERTFRNLGMVNTPTEFEEAKKQKIEYELYRAKIFEAQAKLRKAQEPLSV